MALSYTPNNMTVQTFIHYFNHGQINLEPGFQRESVWSLSDRKKLIESILQNCPIPSVFLYERHEDGKVIYDVLDGKQRLESILMFQGLGRFRGMRFSVKTNLHSDNNTEEWDWKRLQQKELSPHIMSYKMQTVEISGDLTEIIDLFVKINSTGKKLTSAEKRHARYYTSDFLKEAGKLAKKYENFFIGNRILSRGQIGRKKNVELVAEIMASIHAGMPINKKKALDDLIGGKHIDTRSLSKCSKECVSTFNLIKQMFPNLRTTRFANAVDFYSLFLLIWELNKQGCILNDSRRNQQAEKLLVWLSNGVGSVRENLRKAEGPNPEQRLFADYLLTVQGDTDSQSTRKRRADILRQVLGGLFEKKDIRRNFTTEQRRMIWHSDDKKKCSNCHQPLSWNNFTIDHMKAYSRGGKTEVSNAALMCRSCNSSKGAK